jgi:autotransporter-associated beta strand protein
MQKKSPMVLLLSGQGLARSGKALTIFAGFLLSLSPIRSEAQELISNGTFSNGLTGWTQGSWAGGSSFGTDANGPTSTAAASGSYAYAGGGTYNLLQQGISGVTNGGTYRLTFLGGSKSGQGPAYGLVSLHDGLAGNYNSASFDYRPTDAVFSSYTVDFTARGATDLWLRTDGGTFAAYDNVSVTSIGSVQNALNYSSASGYSEVTSALSGAGKVTVSAGTGGLTLKGANTYSGGTEVTGGTLFVTGSGTLGATGGSVTVSDSILDIRNAQTRTGTMTITNNGFIKSGDGTGSLVNNGSAFEFQGGSIELPLSGTGGMNITGGGRITSSNSYTGATTISATPGWYGTHTFHLNNAHGLGAASGSLTISGGTVSLENNTLTRSGDLTISGGRVYNGTISKSGSNYDITGGQIDAVLAGAAGLTKSGAGNASLGGTNTYSGGTIVSGGSLVVNSAEGLGDPTAVITVNTNAALYIGADLMVSRTGDVIFNGGKLTTDISDPSTYGSLSVSGGNFIANDAAELAAKLAGTGGLIVGGAGETLLWAPSSYSGPTVISSGVLRLSGTGAIAESSAVEIAPGAAFVVTGDWAPNNINRTFAGLTGAGILWGGGGTVTINKASGTDTFMGDIQGDQGLIKSGAGDLALGGASSYTGTTYVNEGRLVVAHADALGGTAGGTIVASGAQLRINTLADTVFAAEPLILSGAGFPSGGALRNATNNNTWKGTITLAANATIGAAGGTTLTLEAVSGATLALGGYDLVVDGAGTVRVNGGIAGSGQISKTGSGQLVVSNSVLAATIQSNSVSVHFANPPGDGTFAVLSGPVDGASLASVNVTGLASGQTATVANSPNLVVQVADASTGPTFDDAFSGNAMTDVAPNGLTYLMNYAFGGSSTQAAALPSQDFNDPTKLTLVAFVRTNNTAGTLSVLGEAGDALSNFDTANPISGQVAPDQSDAPAGTQKRIFSVPATGERLFLRLKATLQP